MICLIITSNRFEKFKGNKMTIKLNALITGTLRFTDVTNKEGQKIKQLIRPRRVILNPQPLVLT